MNNLRFSHQDISPIKFDGQGSVECGGERKARNGSKERELCGGELELEEDDEPSMFVIVVGRGSIGSDTNKQLC
ncbi:hypothetical protein PanWU01x14_162730 [Parasponia andersonii]|uniref:Uncharacterized protein n=1 Tax=Parasponia andersonii TaxID=3476 RepID=A0A2P5CD43_PARAD|nr:hypothetical protein PanWU01x14_162730 [Parasponia andersonii]